MQQIQRRGRSGRFLHFLCVCHTLLHNTFGRVVATFPAVVYVYGPNSPGLSSFPIKLEEHKQKQEPVHQIQNRHTLWPKHAHDQERDIIVVEVLDA